MILNNICITQLLYVYVSQFITLASFKSNCQSAILLETGQCYVRIRQQFAFSRKKSGVINRAWPHGEANAYTPVEPVKYDRNKRLQRCAVQIYSTFGRIVICVCKCGMQKEKGSRVKAFIHFFRINGFNQTTYFNKNEIQA